MNCPVCNRPLKSAKSIAKGIGPVCATKVNKIDNEAPKDQLKMELKVE
ncbi:DUF6011 domain-containing protein [Peribacillus loiseleuriae]|nr:DUF6011 domain-containing protein [Peribacillus loiseleuriae]